MSLSSYLDARAAAEGISREQLLHEDDRYLTISEAAFALNLSEAEVAILISTGPLPLVTNSLGHPALLLSSLLTLIALGTDGLLGPEQL